MSQSRPNKPGQGGQTNRNPAPGASRGSQNAQRRGGTPPVAKQPVGRRAPSRQAQQSTLNRILPPFSAQRYVAIWAAGTIVLIILLLVLLRPWENRTASVPSTTGCAAPADAGKYFVITTDKGCIVAKLYTDASANVSKTIANFEQKANAGEFNGRVFHRVQDWVIQGGDPLGNGTGGGKMPSEYNNLTFKRGALGIARGGDPAFNNDSQFFITKSDSSFLDGQYTNWGQVIQGMDVVDKIAIGDKMTQVKIETH